MKGEDFSRVAIYYADEIEKCPEFGEALNKYCDLLKAKKDIRSLLAEDSPEAIQKMIGEEINGFKVTEETYQNAQIIDQEYSLQYEECKRYMNHLANGRNNQDEQ